MTLKFQTIHGQLRTSQYDADRLLVIPTAINYFRFFATVTLPIFVSSLPSRAEDLWHSLSSEQSATVIVLTGLVIISLVTKIA